MEVVWSPKVLVSSLQCPGRVLSLSIRLLLVLHQSLFGFNLSYRSLLLQKRNLQCYGVTTSEGLTCLWTRFCMQGRNILRWIFTLFGSALLRNNFIFSSSPRRIKLRISSGNHSHCLCMSIVDAISPFVTGWDWGRVIEYASVSYTYTWLVLWYVCILVHI
jgi:hypothetical protein